MAGKRGRAPDLRPDEIAEKQAKLLQIRDQTTLAQRSSELDRVFLKRRQAEEAVPRSSEKPASPSSVLRTDEALEGAVYYLLVGAAFM
jgi:hypothetical protein